MTHTSFFKPARKSMTCTAQSASFPEWRCTECGKLLGVAKGNQLHIRVTEKPASTWFGYPVTANCHGCGTLNSKSAC